ncbi:DUF418 domain-containing protein [Parvularcula marina]|uniref:DUF418 domain-containing protein n=1 Tax=Parvularcula marina TaxID=2292771 RepID=A0A371RHN3_9PROT|nr:DUF418 domain-containing protein [Parvularcula marina]RFB04959.1 DUF418 domain-containing protein [Parvularcula marina]
MSSTQEASTLDMPAAGPVTGAERIAYLDILRGFAVMAIFAVNIKAMLMPFPWYMNPTAWGSELDQTIATIQKFIVDDKWRTNFSALYGAGLVMIWERMRARGIESRVVLWKRNLWLILFGAIHLFLMWIGDILFTYGVTGLLAVLFVKMAPKKLFIWGAGLLLLGAVWMSGIMALSSLDADAAAEMSAMMWDPTAEANAEAIAAYSGSIIDQLTARVPEAAMVGIMGLLFFGLLPMTLGLMVMGMGLYRVGFYQGAWPASRTLWLAAVGLGLAWALDAYQVQVIANSGYAFEANVRMTPFSIVDGWLGAFGYAALISLLISMGLKFTRVAAVGRMAFTNYITCTLIGTTMAGGHGLGLFGAVTLTQLVYVVGATYVAMLIWSPLWLHYFRFGPLEWVWRSLVYGKLQKFRREHEVAA